MILPDEIPQYYPQAIALIALIVAILSIISAFKEYRQTKKEILEFKLPDFKKPLEDLSKAKSVQEIAASQIDMLTSYYGNVLTQSQRSFYFALLSGGVGLLFIMATIGFLISQLSQNLAIVTTLGAALSGFISGVNFYVYNKSSSQMAEFHNRLNKTQNFLVADGMCDKLDDITKNQVRSDLIRTLAGIPLTPSSPQQKDGKEQSQEVGRSGDEKI